MSVKVLFPAFAFSCIILLLPFAIGQIPEKDIPTELKFVLDAELGSWKAPDELKELCPYYLSGYDEENRPIWVIEMGKWPTRDILAKGPEWEKAYSKHVDQMIKNAYDSIISKATPEHPVTEVNIIIDMDNYTIAHFSSLKAVRFTTEKFRLVTSVAKYGHLICGVNVNFFAEIVLNFLRPVLGSALERVEIFGTNSDSWIPKLLKKLPKDQLSEKYGGIEDFKPLKFFG